VASSDARMTAIQTRHILTSMGKTELTVQIDPDLLSQAEAAGLHIAGIAERAIRHALRNTPQGIADAEERARHWAIENAGAIKDYNERISERGLFGDDLRTW
jgi:antitoxin CcdA